MAKNAQNQPKPGLAAVSKGKIIVNDPSPGEEPAALTAAAKIKLKINGEEVTSQATVTRNDTIEVETETEVTPAELSIHISKDNMKAYLEVSPEVRVNHVLEDHPPTPKLKLSTRKQVQEQNTLSLEEAMQVINKKGIKNVDVYGVKSTLEKPGERILIASGNPPVPPQDERVRLEFSTGKGAGPVIRADGRMDFRESASKITSVEEGDILGVKLPGVPGKPGTDIYGNTVTPREPRKVVLHAGNGTKLIEEDSKVIATRAGQPDVKSSGLNYYFTVQPSLVHNGNVNLDSGNIRFKGDIHIKGDVEQGMLVYASGQARVDGLVGSASVTAGSHLTLKGHVIASKISAGAAVSSITRLLPLLDGLAGETSKLQKALRQTMAQLPETVPFGKIVTLLMEKKFPSFRSGMTTLFDILNNEPGLPREVDALASLLHRKFLGVNTLKLSGMEDIEELINTLDKTNTILKVLMDNQADIHFPYALNSVIEATGDVIVNGQGCIDTRIMAGGSVYVHGLFRGGSIEAGGSATLYEAGSKTGTSTRIAVPEDQSIYITRAFENVVLEIGGQKISTNQVMINKEARLDVYGAIEFVDLPPDKKGSLKKKKG